ncbi:carbohydrate ABC transporter permease [Parenemella sanctibonifatiensis]|uniref:Sugar ABC transporter permease n=1 Tax=Parenemella sanctibonifatiensis TaxID=2016505 RepID=A0A255EFA5_9ACTN|nr:sugar ABC transporter permease [Parenemella sanctibonifatiensis]OYN84071.1 sugar ABC transporter permease [Parenemella sanctibonifatiensis]OYN90218.1 sugar ABC transporter permease [Parenemella sanctibonifatiensis]
MTQVATAEPAAPPRKRRGRSSVANPDGLWPWLFVLPTLLGLAIFYFWPVIQTAYYSLTEWGVFGGTEFVGLENWIGLLQSGQVPRALANTLVYTAMLLLGLPISIYIASLLNRPGLRFAGFYRVLYFAPFVSMPAAIALVWGMIFNSQYGILNQFLGVFGVPRIHWTSTEWLALVVIGVVGVWSSLGFNIIILGAGLRGIPAEVYEAAKIDGASNWRQLTSITVPLLSPSIFFLTVLSVIHGMELFDLIFIMIGESNPIRSETQSMVSLFYREAFVANDKGTGAAIAILLMLIIGVLTAIQFWARKRWFSYE